MSIVDLRVAFDKGVADRKEGLARKENPYVFPPMLSRKLTQWDAWDSGFSGESFESFTQTSLRVG